MSDLWVQRQAALQLPRCWGRYCAQQGQRAQPSRPATCSPQSPTLGWSLSSIFLRSHRLIRAPSALSPGGGTTQADTRWPRPGTSGRAQPGDPGPGSQSVGTGGYLLAGPHLCAGAAEGNLAGRGDPAQATPTHATPQGSAHPRPAWANSPARPLCLGPRVDARPNWAAALPFLTSRPPRNSPLPPEPATRLASAAATGPASGYPWGPGPESTPSLVQSGPDAPPMPCIRAFSPTCPGGANENPGRPPAGIWSGGGGAETGVLGRPYFCPRPLFHKGRRHVSSPVTESAVGRRKTCPFRGPATLEVQTSRRLVDRQRSWPISMGEPCGSRSP